MMRCKSYRKKTEHNKAKYLGGITMFWITSEKQLKELRLCYNVEVTKVFEDRALVKIVIA